MLQKLFLFAMAFFAVTSAVNADSKIVPVTPINPVPNNGGLPRTPMAVPVLYIDGYTLTAGDYTLGSTIQLLDEDDNVVFSTYVAIEGDIQLPATLTGNYEIQIIRGEWCFCGWIEL